MKHLLQGRSTVEGIWGLLLLLGSLLLPWAALANTPPEPPRDPKTLNERLAWQLALDREGFSPGLIDGKVGAKTHLATQEFQKAHGLSPTGRLDQPTVEALNPDADTAVGQQEVHAADLADITPMTDDWNQRATQDVMGYYTPLDALAERFHTSQAMLQLLNPEVDFNHLNPGASIKAPATATDQTWPKATSLRIDLPRKIIFLLDSNDKVIGLAHCSIAANVEKRPSGQTTVVTVVNRPNYTFDPKIWPEVHNVDRVLMIPPGPRNPVGLAWIGLNLPGYGIHGTPHPEMIGKTGSHGCFRLANWDAVRLSKMIRPGAKVLFIAQND